MGVAALVLGIVSLIVGFIPFCGAIAFLPAIIGVVLGIIDIVLKKKKKESIGMSVAGLILSAIAVIVIAFWVFIFGVAISSTDLNEIGNRLNEIDSYNTTYDDDYDSDDYEDEYDYDL